MKNRMDRSKWQGHGRKVGGPKGHLPEEAINEISGATARKAEHKSAKVYYDKYDAETKARANFQKEKTPEAKAKSDAAKEDRLKAAKRTMRFQQYADKKLKEENINEISAGKANDAYHAAADKGKTADVMAGATGSKKWQKRANKKWDQARKFADYADKKKLKEENLDEVSFGLANRAAKAAENKGREADSKAYKAHLKSLNDKRLSDKGKAKAAADDIAHKETSKKKWKQASKFRDYARNKLKEETDKQTMIRYGMGPSKKKDEPPFDNPTEKPSTPYKNPHSKAKQLARAAMKKALEKKK